MATVESIEAWLKQLTQRFNGSVPNNTIISQQGIGDDSIVTLPISLTYMALVPQLISVKDSELDIAKLHEFSESGKGLSALFTSGYQPFERPFDQLETKELRAAFTLQANLVQSGQKRPIRSHKRRRTESPLKDEADKRKRHSSETGSNSRTKSPSNRTGSPLPPRRGSPTPDLTKSVTLPAMPPLPPVPPPVGVLRASTMPPLPPGRPPPLPPGRPPAVEAGEMEDEDFEQDQQVSDVLSPEVKKEMLRTLDALINITDWPSAVKEQIKFYRTKKKLPKGNPFATPLIRGETTIVPDAYFDRIQKPMDLTTILKRVNQGYYVSYRQFCNDVRLVADNAVVFNTAPPGNFLAAHFAHKVEAELARGQQFLIS